jgi:DNA-binding GntR family transcriptional regulator
MTGEDVLSVDMLTPLDDSSPIPRYRQISDQLAVLILDAPAGLRLPSEHELVARLRVSRATATQALRDLQQRGLVDRMQGRGTFVADTGRAIRTNMADTLPSFSEDLRRAGRTTRERVIALEVVKAPAEVAAALRIPPSTDVWRIERVIVSDGEPVAHLTSWLPPDLFAPLDVELIESTSLYDQLTTSDGSAGRPCSAEERWSACTATVPTTELLEIDTTMPVMRVVRTAYLHDGTLAEYVISYVRGETFAVSMHIGAHSHRPRSLTALPAGTVVKHDAGPAESDGALS